MGTTGSSEEGNLISSNIAGATSPRFFGGEREDGEAVPVLTATFGAEEDAAPLGLRVETGRPAVAYAEKAGRRRPPL